MKPLDMHDDRDAAAFYYDELAGLFSDEYWGSADAAKVIATLQAWHAPVSDPAETLALIAEHRLELTPAPRNGWIAEPLGTTKDDPPPVWAATIGDAVRACVARIREAKRG